jgi:hypothetical protein
MTRLILIYGTIAGLIVAIPMVWLMMSMTEDTSLDNGALYGYLTMIVALTTVFLGIKHYRDKVQGGVIKFWTALGVGLGISAVASLIYMVGWEIVLAFSGFDFADSYSKAMLDMAREQGISGDELERITADTQAFVDMYANPLARLPITFVEMFPVGALISLLSATLLCKSRIFPARAR